MLLVEEDGSVFFSDVRYDTQAHEEVKGAKIVIARKASLQALGEFLNGRRKRVRGWTIGTETEHFTVAEKKRLTKLRPSGVALKDAPSIVERARMVKDENELKRIRTAVALGAKIFERGLEVLRPGMKEVEVAAEMELAARRGGAEQMSFPTIIASGRGRRCLTGVRPFSRSRRADSSSATSVLYFQVIVQIRPALYGSGLCQAKPVMRTRRSERHSRRQSTPFDPEFLLATWTPLLVRYCGRRG